MLNSDIDFLFCGRELDLIDIDTTSVWSDDKKRSVLSRIANETVCHIIMNQIIPETSRCEIWMLFIIFILMYHFYDAQMTELVSGAPTRVIW